MPDSHSYKVNPVKSHLDEVSGLKQNILTITHHTVVSINRSFHTKVNGYIIQMCTLQRLAFFSNSAMLEYMYKRHLVNGNTVF